MGEREIGWIDSLSLSMFGYIVVWFRVCKVFQLPAMAGLIDEIAYRKKKLVTYSSVDPQKIDFQFSISLFFRFF